MRAARDGSVPGARVPSAVQLHLSLRDDAVDGLDEVLVRRQAAQVPVVAIRWRNSSMVGNSPATPVSERRRTPALIWVNASRTPRKSR